MEITEIPIPEVPASRGLRWDRALQENFDKKNREIFGQAFHSSSAIWEMLDPERKNSLSDLEDPGDGMSILLAIIMSDCLEASSLSTVPIVVPELELDPLEKADIEKNDEGEWIMGINADIYVGAIREYSQIENENGQLKDLPMLIYAITHEMGHIRQTEALGLDLYSKPSELHQEVIEDIGEDRAKEYVYRANPLEIGAVAFATKYLRTKQNDVNAVSPWTSLDFDEILMSEWKRGGIALYHQEKSELIEAMYRVKEIPGKGPFKDRLRARTYLLTRQVEGWGEKLENALAIISEKRRTSP